jgi:hypothetical protein
MPGQCSARRDLERHASIHPLMLVLSFVPSVLVFLCF